MDADFDHIDDFFLCFIRVNLRKSVVATARRASNDKRRQLAAPRVIRAAVKLPPGPIAILGGP
jgi:hypothetical protein